MADETTTLNTNKLIARVKAILLTPRTEWAVIAAEPASVRSLYTGYILIMAAIPAVILFLSSSVIGIRVPLLGAFRTDLGTGLTMMVLRYVLSLIGVFVVALIVEALAPTFGGEKNRVQALKAVAYSYTASWVASILGIVPGLGLIAALLGLAYGLYLLYLGLPATMKSPPDKAVAYTAVTVVAAVVIAVVLSRVVYSIHAFGPVYPGYPPAGSLSPGGHFQDGTAGSALQGWQQRMQDASRQVDAAQKSGDANAKANAMGQLVGAALGGNGKVEALAPERIKAFLPDSLNGLKRTQSSAERNGALGMQLSKAMATYSDGASQRLNLEVTDTGSLKGLVGFAAGWGGVEQETQNDTGYEKTYRSGGQIVHEQWNNQSQSGDYGLVVGERFTVKVSGAASSIDDLKRAVASVDLAGLAALKNEGVQSGGG